LKKNEETETQLQVTEFIDNGDETDKNKEAGFQETC
jgi:hypothetical protein